MVAGLVLVAAPAAFWLAAEGVGPVGGTAATPASPPVPTVAPRAAAVPAGTAQAAVDPTDAEQAPAGPVRIRLAGIDVDAPVVPVGVDADADMAVPEDVRTIGWYRFGPGPGEAAGSSVLSGHVDDRVQGHGAFYALTDLRAGDPVQIELSDGTMIDYRVREVRRIDKAALPVDELFARDGAPHLTLVTCGGGFDRVARRYRDNVVVTAEPGSR